MEWFTPVESRLTCALLTAVLALLVYRDVRAARIRTAVFLLLLLAGVGNVLLLAHRRVAHSNQAHYYIGAKYACSYNDFYRVVTAARSEPQINYRNLGNVDRMFRGDPREQRLYYLELLQADQVAFPENASLEQLAELCGANGLIQKEAAAILAESVRPERIADLRDDLARTKLDTDDMGFNGSPLYVLLRHLDPSLYFRFGPASFYLNLLWQLAALFAVAFLCGRALHWTGDDLLFVMALMLASWDYSGWALNGLVTAGWMLPAALVLWGYGRRKVLVSGAAIAWAGLIKLFPVIVALPLMLAVARGALAWIARRSAGRDPWFPPALTALRMLVTCLVTMPVLIGLSRMTGCSWLEFLGKIVMQFHRSASTGNDVGLAHILMSLGVGKSPALVLVQLTVFFALLWMFWMQKPDRFWDDLPRTTLVLLSCMVWLWSKWFNYYSVIALLLVPGLIRQNRPMAVLMLLLFALGYALPDFGRLYTGRLAFLSAVKVAAYLALPTCALTAELAAARRHGLAAERQDALTRWLSRRGAAMVATGFAVSALLIGWETYRTGKAAALFLRGEQLLRQQRIEEARDCYVRALSLTPRSAASHFNLAYVLDETGNRADAAAHYRRALALDPDSVAARVNLGILYLQIGDMDGAVREFGQAVALAPYDEEAHYDLGRALLAVGRGPEAKDHFRQALLIAPGFEPARRQLERMGSEEEENG